MNKAENCYMVCCRTMKDASRHHFFNISGISSGKKNSAVNNAQEFVHHAHKNVQQ